MEQTAKAMSFKSRLPNQFPADANLGAEAKQTLDQMLVQINTLLSQGAVPPGTGLQAFGANIIDPTSTQIVSKGARTGAICTSISAVMGTTTATFFWDGSNGSVPFQIFRDDASIFGPFITGSGYVVTGLTPSTNYFFYPYFDETLQRIQFATVAGVSIGSPAIAFTSQNLLAAQQQILKNRLPLGSLGSSTGVSTTGAGTTTLKLGSGGGGVGIGGNGRYAP